MALKIPCPNCGPRPYTEFTFGGELRELEVPGTEAPDLEGDFRRVYLPDNGAGEQDERWFHAYGCRRWLRIRRDTVTNRVHGLD